jgi:hypothetical protein
MKKKFSALQIKREKVCQQTVLTFPLFLPPLSLSFSKYSFCSTVARCSCANNTRAWRTRWCHRHINSHRRLHCDFCEDKTKGKA